MPLLHFKSRHFSGLRHFFAIHFGGIRVIIDVPPPPMSGGSAPVFGGYATTPYYSPANRKFGKQQRLIRVTVTFPEGKRIERNYMVGERTKDMVVATINWLNASRDRVKAGITTFNRVINDVKAKFNTDK